MGSPSGSVVLSLMVPRERGWELVSAELPVGALAICAQLEYFERIPFAWTRSVCL